MRVCTTLAVLLAATAIASAQPADPYAPDPVTPPATPTSTGPDDPVLAEQIAQSLVHRAQELFDDRIYVEAKQLAVEALVKSPRGAAAEHAKSLIKAVNKQLGIIDAPDPARPGEQIPTSPPKPATPPEPVIPPPPESGRAGRVTTVARVHGGLFGGLLGATIGSQFSKDSPAAGAIPLGIALGVGGVFLVPRLTARLDWSEAQVLTAGAGNVWGGVLGGLFADAVEVNSSRASHILIGASVGATAGLVAGAALAHRDKLTRGDVALVDTLAGVGAIGGLTVGMLMQPVESEGYSVNSILGTAAGVVVGLISAPNTNTTQRRMARVAGVAAIGGGAPSLLYAAIHDRSSHADERLVGALSSIGLVAGLYVGFRLTRDLDVDLDVGDHASAAVDDAPVALVGRHSDGRWTLGALAVTPLSPVLAPQPGLAVPLIGATL